MRYLKRSGILALSGIILLAIACSSAAPPPDTVPVATPAPETTAIAISEPAAPTPVPTVQPTSPPTLTSKAAPPPSPSATPAPTLVIAAVPTATPVVSPIPQGKYGGSLQVAGFAGIPHRDVHQTVQEMVTSMGPGLAYSRLLRLRVGPEFDQPSLRLECDLCQSWEMTPDLAFEFRLRPDVRWHNIAPVNGRLLVADDLAFSYERIRTPGWPNAGLLSAIRSVEALDDETLRIELASPDADVLLALADGHSKIVAREVVEEYGDLKTSPVVGTGPWVWEETGKDMTMSLIRNPASPKKGLPFLDQLVIQVIKQSELDRSGSEERLAAFLAGQVDVAQAPPSQWPALEGSGKAFNSILSRQSGTGVMLSLNVQASPLSSLEVRQAIFKAMDPWDYTDTIFAGQGYASVGIPVQSPDWLLSRDDIRQEYFADPTTARKLVAAWGNRQPVDIELTVRTEKFGNVYLELEKRVAADLIAVGFNPKIRRLDPARFQEAVAAENKDYQVALGVLPPTSTTNSFLLTLLHSGGRWNIAGHQDATLDGMIERQAVEFNPARRRTQLRDIQRHVLDQAYLFSPVTGASKWVFDPRVKGFYPNTALSEYNYWSRVWLDR